MNQYPDRDARPLAVTPEEALAGHVVQQIEAWVPPPRAGATRRPGRASLAPALPGSAVPPTAGAYQQVKRRFDLIGWLLAQPSDRIVFNDDPRPAGVSAQPPAGRDLPLWRATRRLNALQYCACIDAPFLPASPRRWPGAFLCA